MSDDETQRDYKVGYKRPPVASRFKPGQSGNPRGRPRRSKQLVDLLLKELDQTVVIKEGGTEKRITKREAIVKQYVARAMRGESKPMQLILAFLEGYREVEPFTPTAEDDSELMRAMGLAGDRKSRGGAQELQEKDLQPRDGGQRPRLEDGQPSKEDRQLQKEEDCQEGCQPPQERTARPEEEGGDGAT